MRGYSCIGLYYPQNKINVGSVMRAAYCFKCASVFIEGKKFEKSLSDTPQAYRHIPVITGIIKDLIPYDCVPIGVEIVSQARPLMNYVHPERALYIFGPENGFLGKKVLDYCRDVIYIPTQTCLNLANCVNIVLYDRLTKSKWDL